MMEYYVGQKLYHVTSGGSEQSIILDITDNEIVLEDIIENEGKVKKINQFPEMSVEWIVGLFHDILEEAL